MELPRQGRTFLGIGPEAPPPSGPEDPNLKVAMLREATSPLFRFRVGLWLIICMWKAFPWKEFERRLAEEAEFRSYANSTELMQSLGWAGLTAQGDKWLFGVAGYHIPFFGNSAMQHELFHAAQDLMSDLFHRNPGMLGCLLAELSAHFWGGPLAAALPVILIFTLSCFVFSLVSFLLQFI